MTHTSMLDDRSFVDRDADDVRYFGFTPLVWVQMLVVGLLMAALFRFNLARLWGKTNPFYGQDPNWQHAVFVPFIGLYFLYIHREDILRAAATPDRKHTSIRIVAGLGIAILAAIAIGLLEMHETGLPLMVVGLLVGGLAVPVAFPTSTAMGSALLLEGLLVFAYAIYPLQNDYVKDLAMVITLFGAATWLAGWNVMKVAWFPVIFLVVALPWPELVYARMAAPLQQLAASGAVGALRMFGVDAQNFGTKIEMFDGKGQARMLNVVEACAGLKSVMTFLMVAGSIAFLTTRPLWEKIVIALSAIPIAIFCNVVRVSGQGLLDRYSSHEWSEGFSHQFTGLVMLIPGFFMILAVGWVLEKLFVEEVDAAKLGGGGAAAAAKPARPKRIVVEVPRKKEQPVAAPAAAPAGASRLEAPVEIPPVVAVAPAPAAKTLAAPKPPAAAPRPAPAAPAIAARPSTLKPSSKPAAPRAVPAVSPSTLKPSTPKASPVTPPPPRLKAPSPKPPVPPHQGGQS